MLRLAPTGVVWLHPFAQRLRAIAGAARAAEVDGDAIGRRREGFWRDIAGPRVMQLGEHGMGEPRRR